MYGEGRGRREGVGGVGPPSAGNVLRFRSFLCGLGRRSSKVM